MVSSAEEDPALGICFRPNGRKIASQEPIDLTMLAAAVAAAASYASPPQEVCRRCGGTGCDVRILDCGCTLHAVS